MGIRGRIGSGGIGEELVTEGITGGGHIGRWSSAR